MPAPALLLPPPLRRVPEQLLLNMDMASVHGGSMRTLGPGDPLAEAAFFTETANLQVGLPGPRRQRPACTGCARPGHSRHSRAAAAAAAL